MSGLLIFSDEEVQEILSEHLKKLNISTILIRIKITNTNMIIIF